MSRPVTKKDLIISANQQFDNLFAIIDSFSQSEQDCDFCFAADLQGTEAHWERDKNLRDVLMHLYEWHQLLLEWEKANANGGDKPFLPVPYNWKTYGQMNQMLFLKNQDVPLSTAKQLIRDSHKAVLVVIDNYSQEELFIKKFFKWTGTSSLAQYCISATLSHYDWAIKKLKAQTKALKAKQ